MMTPRIIWLYHPREFDGGTDGVAGVEIDGTHYDRAAIERAVVENAALRQAMALLNQELPDVAALPPAPAPDTASTVRLIGELGEARAELGRLRAATARLESAWDALCDCIDEFDPNDGEACGERRDALDTAILAVIAAGKGAIARAALDDAAEEG